MKRLDEMFGIAPGDASQLQNAGILTIPDLAGCTDLSGVSSKSGIPGDVLGLWRDRATTEVARARRRRESAGVLSIFAALLALLLAWSLHRALVNRSAAHETAPLVALHWLASSSSEVVGYSIYRSNLSGGPYLKLNPALDSSLSYEDKAVTRGQTYYYVVTAVDLSGNESAFSSQQVATVR